MASINIMEQIPNIFFARWTYCFVDEALLKIPQRLSNSYDCQFTKTNDNKYYESSISFDMDDPYYTQYNTCEYGIRSSFDITQIINNTMTEFPCIYIRDIPYTKISSSTEENNLTTIGYLSTPKRTNATFPFQYDIIKIKKKIKILNGFHVMIPTELIVEYVTSLRQMIKQMVNGL